PDAGPCRVVEQPGITSINATAPMAAGWGTVADHLGHQVIPLGDVRGRAATALVVLNVSEAAFECLPAPETVQRLRRYGWFIGECQQDMKVPDAFARGLHANGDLEVRPYLLLGDGPEPPLQAPRGTRRGNVLFESERRVHPPEGPLLQPESGGGL